MLNPKYAKFADRLRELIEDGRRVAKLEKRSASSEIKYFQAEDKIQVVEWLTKARNILETALGSESPHLRHFDAVIPKYGINRVDHSTDVYPFIGVLSAALSDLEKGYLLGQEFLIAGEVFDSILEQAKHLVQNNYKDPAAILSRVVLEDALKRIARSEGINENQKASIVNDELKKKGRFSQPQWRFIQGWLDIGNSAAHGKFNQYTQEDVVKMIDDVERFLGNEFRA
jgi:hypothetical protein